MIKKIIKILSVILCNILLFILLIFLCDLAIYNHYSKKYKVIHHNVFEIPKFSYIVKPYYGIDITTCFDGSDNIFRGRKPDGLKYKGNEPIVVFGCSFAHGQFLDYNQTFSYKLAHILKRPVYNRAFPGRGLGFMYLQSTSYNFYTAVPPSDTVIYVLIKDHYKRLLSNFIDILDTYMIEHFYKKDDTLVLDGSNYLKNIIISSYTYKLLNSKYINWYLNNKKYEEELTNLAVFYFIKTRENLEKRWNKKIDFIIVYYDNYPILYKETLFKKLEENNFKIIDTGKVTDINLSSPEYISQSNLHPTEKAWDVLTPIIAKELKTK